MIGGILRLFLLGTQATASRHRNSTTPMTPSAAATATLSPRDRLDVLLAVWREVNESIRDAVRFRWEVTAAFIVMMAGICFAAEQAHRVGPWVGLVSLVLCVAAIAAQWRWQYQYQCMLATWVSASAAVANSIQELSAQLGVGLPLRGLATEKAARDGYNGIVRVSLLIGVAACAWLCNMLVAH
jgi:hypothetical protein